MLKKPKQVWGEKPKVAESHQRVNNFLHWVLPDIGFIEFLLQ